MTGDARKPWDDWLLDMARFVATRSRDPSTKVGAVIARPDHTIAAIGYNGLPRGVADDARLLDRSWKYAATVHAEVNAILNAREPVRGCTLYVAPLHPCANCAAVIIQAGIARVVAAQPAEPDRWAESFRIAAALLDEAGVRVAIERRSP